MMWIRSNKTRLYQVKISLFLSFLIFGCFFSGGCDYIYGILHKEGAQEKDLVGEVVPYKENENVEEIQTLLKIYGYSPGKIDGSLGFRTRDAIEKFQKDQGIPPSRYVDNATWEKLKIFKDNGFVVDGRLNVSLVQTALVNAGFTPGKIDGAWGKKTESAVRQFQRTHSLKVDGKVGYRTLLKLAEFLSLQEESMKEIFTKG